MSEKAKSEKINRETKIKKPGKIKKFFKSFVDYKKWLAYDEVSGNVDHTVSLFKRFLAIGKTEQILNESYSESITRLGLTPEAEAKRRKVFLYSSYIYLFFTFLFILYFVYLLTQGRGWIACLVLVFITLMSLSAYREHFWYFQMTKKQLGNHFQDWLNFLLKREG